MDDYLMIYYNICFYLVKQVVSSNLSISNIKNFKHFEMDDIAVVMESIPLFMSTVYRNVKKGAVYRNKHVYIQKHI